MSRAEFGFTPSWRSTEHGFTLIEMVVALAVFGLAAMALIRLLGLTLNSTATIAEQTYGQVVANNLAVNLLTDTAAPSVGHADGTTDNAGRRWRWSRIVARTDDPRFVRIDLVVRDPEGHRVGALTLARPV